MLTRFSQQLALVNHAAVQVYPLRLISVGSLTRTEQTRYLLPRRHGGGPESAQQSPGPCTSSAHLPIAMSDWSVELGKDLVGMNPRCCSMQRSERTTDGTDVIIVGEPSSMSAH